MNDMINGAFELFGACMLSLHCRRLYLDKTIKGVSAAPFVFYTSWGFWNLWYYPSVGHWWSFAGGVAVVTVNATYCLMMLAYRKGGA